MNKMVFAFDEARAKRDGVDPASLWAMVDGWVKDCAADHGGQFYKEAEADGSTAYIGIGHETDWIPAFGGVYICGSFSDAAAKYCTKWMWYYDEDEEDEQYCEDVLAHLLEKNDFYRRAERS